MSAQNFKRNSRKPLSPAAVKRKRKKRAAKANRKVAKLFDLVTKNAFDDLPDLRGRRGRRFSVASLLMSLVLGAALLLRSLRRVEESVGYLALSGSAKGAVAASDTTLYRLLLKLPWMVAQEVFERTVSNIRLAKKLRHTDLPLRTLAVDGKNLLTMYRRFSRFAQAVQPSEGRKYYKLMVIRAISTSSPEKLSVYQRAVPGKTNEMGIFPAALNDLMKRNTAKSLFELVTADGAYCTLGITRQIEKKGLYFILRLTDLQPSLMALAKNRIAVSPTACLARSNWEACKRGYKRVSLYRTTDVQDWCNAEAESWDHLTQAFLLHTEFAKKRLGPKGEVSYTVFDEANRHFVSNLPLDPFVSASGKRVHMTPRELLKTARAHWEIENFCFNNLDTAWSEDTSAPCRKGEGVLAYSYLALIGYNIAQLARYTIGYQLGPERKRCFKSWQHVRDRIRDGLSAPRPSPRPKRRPAPTNPKPTFCPLEEVGKALP